MALVDRFRLDALAPTVASYLLERGRRRTRVSEGRCDEYYPPRDDPGPEWTDHLAFALKHEGANLEVLAALFHRVPEDELVAWIGSAPTSRYRRVAWFLAEWLLDRRLPALPDLTQGNYIPVLDEADYYALPQAASAPNQRRQRVVNNLPGTAAYCPLVRRTPAMQGFEQMRLDARVVEQVGRFPAELLYRATQYLYQKETKSSYAIEHLTADQRRSARFVALLREAQSLDCYSEAVLVRLQNAIVDDRYAAGGFREFQNYVGQTLGPARELVHYVPPRPENLPELMAGWATCCRRMQTAGVHPVATATVAGFGFVFLHPFEDGNGRLHRFLLHYALAVGGFAPPGVIFPVSATMLKQAVRYERTLEAYSREIGKHVEYVLDESGRMQVTNETAPFYRYPDLTHQAEALFGFIRDTIDLEMVAELEYLTAFDAAQRRMRSVVDMPNQRMDLLLRICLQGKGRLSKSKRALFRELTDDEILRLEAIVRGAIDGLSARPDE